MIGLTNEQRAAAESTDRITVVRAGAGTGKTRTLIARIVWLLKRGADPDRVVALTFTNKAAQELRERVVEAYDGDAPGLGFVGTFHGWALRQLQDNGAPLGYVPGEPLRVVDDADRDGLLAYVGELLGYRRGGDWVKTTKTDVLRALASRAYHKGPQVGDGARLIAKYYRGLIHRANAVDFDAIIGDVVTLLHTTAETGYSDESLAIRSGVRHLLVDEYQDVDWLQHGTVTALADTAESVFVVGDQRQSIYEWRGAAPTLIDNLGADPVDLVSNWRSAEDIVGLGNAIAAGMAIGPDGASPAPLLYGPADLGVEGPGGHVEAFRGDLAGVANILGQVLEQTGPDGVAVLGRTHRALDRLVEAARGAVKIKHVGADLGVRSSPDWRRSFWAMRLCADPDDMIAGVCLAHAWGVPSSKISEAETDPEPTILAALAEKAADRAPGFFVIAGLSPATASVERIADRFLYDWAEWWRKWAGPFSVASAVKLVSALDDGDAWDRDGPGDDEVAACTIHAAKGREWPVVIVLDCVEGSIPSDRAIDDGRLDEELRTFYVAATRAREAVYFHTGHGEQVPSRFLTGIV